MKTIIMRHRISGDELEIKELDNKHIKVKLISGPHEGETAHLFTSVQSAINSYRRYGFDTVKHSKI